MQVDGPLIGDRTIGAKATVGASIEDEPREIVVLLIDASVTEEFRRAEATNAGPASGEAPAGFPTRSGPRCLSPMVANGWPRGSPSSSQASRCSDS